MDLRENLLPLTRKWKNPGKNGEKLNESNLSNWKNSQKSLRNHMKLSLQCGLKLEKTEISKMATSSKRHLNSICSTSVPLLNQN